MRQMELQHPVWFIWNSSILTQLHDMFNPSGISASPSHRFEKVKETSSQYIQWLCSQLKKVNISILKVFKMYANHPTKVLVVLCTIEWADVSPNSSPYRLAKALFLLSHLTSVKFRQHFFDVKKANLKWKNLRQMITCGLHHDSNYLEKYFTVLDKFMGILASYRQHQCWK